MSLKRVLIITYYWPPSGGAGVQRWLKFAKYLPGTGWEPIIYTPKNPESPVEDLSLLKDIPEGITILKRRIWEPYSWYKRFIGQKNDQKIKTGFLSEKEKPKFRENLSVWIRGNLFIPDARRFWIKPSIRFLFKYLRDNPLDVIVSTGPPHSMHLIALGLKHKLGIPWIADFRDPWTDIDFYDKLKLSRRADRKHSYMEREVLTTADMVTTVSWDWSDKLRSKGAQNIQVITNGFDEDDFRQSYPVAANQFIVTHFGSINADRNPSSFWKAVGKLCLVDQEFKNRLLIRLIGHVDNSVLRDVRGNGIEPLVEAIRSVPHGEMEYYLKTSALLLLPLNNTFNARGIIPGKIFEYLAAKRPILAIGPTDGDTAKILNYTNAGRISRFEDSTGLKTNILAIYHDYKKGNLKFNTTDISKYSRKNLTKELVKLLNESIN